MPDDKSLTPSQRLELQRYVNRLGIAKKRAEKKITDLGGEVAKVNSAAWQDASKEQEIRKKLTLEKLIHSSTALFYFMEFMERNQAMKYVQFLLMVEGLVCSPLASLHWIEFLTNSLSFSFPKLQEAGLRDFRGR